MSDAFRRTGDSWFRKSPTWRLRVGFLVIVVAFCCVGHRHHEANVATATAPPRYSVRIALNQCEWSELCLLPGISRTLARRIVSDRDLHGPFDGPKALQRVEGIGPKTTERLADQLDFSCPLPHDTPGGTNAARSVN